MTPTVQDLLDASRPVSETTSRIQQLIEAAKRRPMETMPFELTIGDVTAEIVITELRGREWSEIARQMPRPGNIDDQRLQANTDFIVENYPVGQITIGGEHPPVDAWQKLVGLIDAPTRADIVASLWWMHFGRHQESKRAVLEMSERVPAIRAAVDEKGKQNG